MLKKSEVIYGRTVIIHEIVKKEYFSSHQRRDMMIGLTSFAEVRRKILDLDKFVPLYIHISNLVAIPLYLFDLNFKNTVSNEVGSDVR